MVLKRKIRHPVNISHGMSFGAIINLRPSLIYGKLRYMLHNEKG